MLKVVATDGVPEWTTLLSNRLVLFQHPLKKFIGFEGFGGKVDDFIEDKEMEEDANACIRGWLDFGQ